MTEDEDISQFTFRWAVAFLVLLGITILYPLEFKLKEDMIHDGIFAALCESSATVLFVGGGFSLHRRSIAKRRNNVEIVRSLVRATGDAENALLLMRAHQSVPTWTKQLQDLNQVKIQLIDLRERMSQNSREDAATQVKQAITVLDDLASEYAAKHADRTVIQSRFEDQYHNDPQGKVAALPTHWKDVLSELSALSSVLDKRNALIKPLRSAIRLMRA